MVDKNKPGMVNSAINSFDILEVIRDKQGATLTEIEEDIELARSTLYGYLTTLSETGYVIKDDDKYYISLKFLDLGGQAKAVRTPWQEVRPALEEIGKETGENVWFVVEENGSAVYVDNYSGSHVLHKVNTVGVREYLHCIAGGKAILAHLSRDRVNGIIDEHGLPEFTESTITDRHDLFDELEEIRNRGVAFSDGERHKEIRAVASPIRSGDRILGAVTLGAPSKRLTGEYFEKELPNIVSGAVNRLEFSFRQQEG